MKRSILTIVFVLLISLAGIAQVAINEDASDPDKSAMLDIKSVSMGFLMPRMNFSQMYKIKRPATGLLIFNTSANTFYYYNGSNWTSLTEIIDEPDVKSINIKETINLKPQSEPKSAKEGDIYMDRKTHKLRCWNGTVWKDLW